MVDGVMPPSGFATRRRLGLGSLGLHVRSNINASVGGKLPHNSREGRLSAQSPPSQFGEQSAGGLQIGGTEALGEPAEDRGEQGHRLLLPALLAAYAGKDRCAAQFPGLRVLPPRDVDALRALGRQRIRRSAPQASGELLEDASGRIFEAAFQSADITAVIPASTAMFS